MSSINKDLQFCRAYLQYGTAITVLELNERYIVVELSGKSPTTTFYMDGNLCIENLFLHFAKPPRHAKDR